MFKQNQEIGVKLWELEALDFSNDSLENNDYLKISNLQQNGRLFMIKKSFLFDPVYIAFTHYF